MSETLKKRTLSEVIESKSDIELQRLWVLFPYYFENPNTDTWTKDEWGMMLDSELDRRGLVKTL